MSLELCNMTCFWRFRDATLNDSVNATTDMGAKVNPCLLAINGASDMDTNQAKVRNDLGFLIIPTAEHSQDAPREDLLDCPAE